MTQNSRTFTAIALGALFLAIALLVAFIASGRLLIAFDGTPIIGALPKPSQHWFVTVDGRVRVGEPFRTEEECAVARRRLFEVADSEKLAHIERLLNLSFNEIVLLQPQILAARQAVAEALSAKCSLRSDTD